MGDLIKSKPLLQDIRHTIEAIGTKTFIMQSTEISIFKILERLSIFQGLVRNAAVGVIITLVVVEKLLRGAHVVGQITVVIVDLEHVLMSGPGSVR